MISYGLSACQSGNNSKNVPPEGYDSKIGLGDYRDFKIEQTDSIDAEMVKEGKRLYRHQCMACHKLDATQSLGPGWEQVTKRHSAAWLMNFMTNTNQMINLDPFLQQRLKDGYPRMPDQGLKEPQARALLEFMRANDRK